MKRLRTCSPFTLVRLLGVLAVFYSCYVPIASAQDSADPEEPNNPETEVAPEGPEGKTLPQKPRAPVNVKAVVISSSEVQLSWSNPDDGATAIEVEWRNDLDDVVSVQRVEEDSTKFVVQQLEGGVNYTFRLRRIGTDTQSLSSVPVGISIESTERRPLSHIGGAFVSIWKWFTGKPWWGMVLIAIGFFFAFLIILGILIQLAEALKKSRLRKRSTWVYLSYLLFGLAVYFLIGSPEVRFLYFCAFSLGMITAFAEIIQKFRDDPLAALGTWSAFFYHILNGLISAFALSVLLRMGFLEPEPLGRVKIVLVAGIGAMFVMRSKLFSIKGKDEEFALGPEQLINIYLRFMESEIDRDRATTRIELVKERMLNLDFDKILGYTRTMLESSQLKKDESWGKFKTALEEKEKETRDSNVAKQNASYWLGFKLLNEMGREFVEGLFSDQIKAKKGEEWWIEKPEAAPPPSEGGFKQAVKALDALKKTVGGGKGNTKNTDPPSQETKEESPDDTSK